jgi:hypothetical protein
LVSNKEGEELLPASQRNFVAAARHGMLIESTETEHASMVER